MAAYWLCVAVRIVSGLRIQPDREWCLIVNNVVGRPGRNVNAFLVSTVAGCAPVIAESATATRVVGISSGELACFVLDSKSLNTVNFGFA